MPYIAHHGILGQKWGDRNGPPYPLKGGDYSEEEKKKNRHKRLKYNSYYNKRHFDETLKADKTTLQTLSFDKDRTKDTELFYATHNFLDNSVYKALLNRPIPKDVFDEDGNKIGTDKIYKFAIKNKLKSDMKVAGEDSAANIFADLYKNDRNFYNFVIDPKRMQSYFEEKRFVFSGYKKARDVLDKMRSDSSYVPTKFEVQMLYRLFNFVLPYDGSGWTRDRNDKRGGKDVLTQRTKFFNKCKEAGYGAILDTNDSMYNSLHAKSSIIVFDQDQIIPDKILQTSFSDRALGIAALSLRKSLGI